MSDSDKGRVQGDPIEDDSTPKTSRGRGWFGDPKAHAEAGRKGGKARSRKYHASASV